MKNGLLQSSVSYSNSLNYTHKTYIT